MSDSESIISNSKDVREVERAAAVKTVEEGLKSVNVCKVLKVSAAFVSNRKIIYENKGAECPRSGYKGSKGYLSKSQKDEIIKYPEKQEHPGVEELRDYIEEEYGVVYKSEQSYYDLLKAAGKSRNKSRKKNPKKNEERVILRREEIKKTCRT